MLKWHTCNEKYKVARITGQETKRNIPERLKYLYIVYNVGVGRRPKETKYYCLVKSAPNSAQTQFKPEKFIYAFVIKRQMHECENFTSSMYCKQQVGALCFVI